MTWRYKSIPSDGIVGINIGHGMYQFTRSAVDGGIEEELRKNYEGIEKGLRRIFPRTSVP